MMLVFFGINYGKRTANKILLVLDIFFSIYCAQGLLNYLAFQCFEYEHTQEELGDTKRVSKIRKSKKDRLKEKGKQNKQRSTKHYTEN